MFVCALSFLFFINSRIEEQQILISSLLIALFEKTFNNQSTDDNFSIFFVKKCYKKKMKN